MQDKKDQIKLLANMIGEANKKQQDLKQGTFGKCEWTDINGENRCNSNWSEFQCQQVAGTWTEDESCDDNP